MTEIQHLPLAEPDYAETAGRFGDWHEPLPFETVCPNALHGAAARHRISTPLAFTLLLERSLVLADLEALDHDPDEVRWVLGAEASDEWPLLGPGQPNLGYARALRGAEPGRWNVRAARFSVPVRLLDRVEEALVEETLGEPALADALGEALLWEQAALASGRLLTEWALLTLLAAR
jgi:hypothetical protein